MSRVVGHQRAHLSIGEVLSLLQDEFPDVTISKIRFLESQGLLDPERTPSGYRKFYEYDIERLRWILRQQKDHYLPLKVIKDRLDKSPGVAAPDSAGEDAPALPFHTGSDQPAESGPEDKMTERPAPAPARRPAVAPSEQNGREARPSASAPAQAPPQRPASAARPAPPAPRSTSSAAARPRSTTSSLGAATRPSASQSRPSQEVPRPSRALNPVEVPRAGASNFEPSSDAITLDIDELADASGLSVRDIRDLERFGLIEPREVGEGTTYDGDALVIARTAAGFLQHGIEARHMRTYKVAADREAGLFEQIVSPVLKQRNPEARTRATRTVTELIRLGEVMRGVLLRRELRDHLGGS